MQWRLDKRDEQNWNSPDNIIGRLVIILFEGLSNLPII